MNSTLFEHDQKEIQGSQKRTWKNLWHILYSEIQDWKLRRIQTVLVSSEIKMLKDEKRVQILRAGSLCGLIESLGLVVVIPIIVGVIHGYLFPFNSSKPSLIEWLVLGITLFWMPLYTTYQSIKCFKEAKGSEYAVFLYSVFMNWRLVFAGVFGFILSFVFWWLFPNRFIPSLGGYEYGYPNATNTLVHLVEVLKLSVPYILGYLALFMGLPALAGYRQLSLEDGDNIGGLSAG